MQNARGREKERERGSEGRRTEQRCAYFCYSIFHLKIEMWPVHSRVQLTRKMLQFKANQNGKRPTKNFQDKRMATELYFHFRTDNFTTYEQCSHTTIEWMVVASIHPFVFSFICSFSLSLSFFFHELWFFFFLLTQFDHVMQKQVRVTDNTITYMILFIKFKEKNGFVIPMVHKYSRLTDFLSC